MTRRLLLAAALALPGPALAETPSLGFHAPNHTWAATHIVLVENEKVVESWKGDLKVGAQLPEGAAAYARIRPPEFDPDWVASAGEKPPAPTGKRMVLFLAHVPEYRGEERGSVWMGAECPGFPSHPPSAVNVAWVEGDRVYVAGGWRQRWIRGLGSPGGVAGLKEEVEVGLALQKRFAAAKAEPDLAKRADRLVALVPVVTAYATLWGKHDVIEAVGECGKAAVPHLVRWATEPNGKFQYEAMGQLCRTGDAGVGAVLKILDDETAYWKAVAGGLKPGQTVREVGASPVRPWGSPNALYHLLGSVRVMKLSADNQNRVQRHRGLKELDELLTTHPGMKPPKSDMELAHETLRHILAGRFQPHD